MTDVKQLGCLILRADSTLIFADSTGITADAVSRPCELTLIPVDQDVLLTFFQEGLDPCDTWIAAVDARAWLDSECGVVWASDPEHLDWIVDANPVYWAADGRC